MEKIKSDILSGNITKISLKIAVPVIIGHLLMLFYNIADTFFVSLIDRSSTAYVSGIGLVFPVFFLYIAISVGLFSGISSLVARSIGSNDSVTLERTADSGLLLALFFSATTLVLMFVFRDSIINVLAGSEMSGEAIYSGKSYLGFIVPGMALMIVSNILLGILQGEGKSQYYGISMTISTLLNIILDPIFIFVLKMKVAGAALATTISIIISFIFVVSIFVSKRSSLHIHWNILKAKFKIMIEILRIGVPQMMMMIILTGAFVMLNKLVGSISEPIMNSWIIAGRMNEFILLVGHGMGQASMTMVGQNYGAKNFKRLKDIYKTIVRNAFVLGIVFVIIYNLAAPFVFPFFSAVDEVVRYAVFQARVVSIAGLFVIVEIVTNNTFQGTGKPFPGVITTFFRMGVFIVPLSYFSVYVLHLGFVSILFIMLCGNLVSTAIISFWCRSYINKLQVANV